MADKTPKVKKGIPLKLEKKDPLFFKLGRYATLQLSSVEKTIFTDIEEEQSGNFIIRGIESQISELDFTAFTLAVGQILYNQSYKSGNEDINSGVQREKDKVTSEMLRDTYYYGIINTSLNEICRLAYGVKEPSTEQKKRIVTLLNTIDKRTVEIVYPGKGKLEARLLAVMNKFTREKDGATLYDLALNPIFGSQIQKQFGLLPQNVTASLECACRKRKQRKTAAHYLLLKWLCIQDNRKPHPLTIGEIITVLRMENYFKKDKGKAEKQLLSICDTMKDIGILHSYEIADRETGKGKRIEKITFHLNPKYTKSVNDAEPFTNGAKVKENKE